MREEKEGSITRGFRENERRERKRLGVGKKRRQETSSLLSSIRNERD